MLENYQTNFLIDRQKAVDDAGNFQTAITTFLLNLFNRTGKGTGVPLEVMTGVTAAGTVQSNATDLAVDINSIDTVGTGAGVQMLNLSVGQWQMVYNNGANPLKVYPPANSKIDALATNAAYTLAANKMQIFWCFSTTQIRSTQLG